MSTSDQGPSWWAVENTRRLRRAAGLSQGQLAERLVKFSRSVLANFESHRRPELTLEECFDLAVALNVSPTNLLCPSNDEVEVAVTSDVRESALWVRDWIYGKAALPRGADRDEFIAKAPRREQRDHRVGLHPVMLAIDQLRLFARDSLAGPTNQIEPQLLADELRRALGKLTEEVENLAQKTEQKEDW